jgi:DNA-binding XRE family transcriptional regulator
MQETPQAMKLVREFRERLGETQEDFARRVGCRCRTIHRWEKQREPNILALARLAYVAKQAGFNDISERFTAIGTTVLSEAAQREVEDDTPGRGVGFQ